jgi:subfamily B ATP-binding cassette protein MsbA
MEEVIAAAKIANAHEFIMAMPNNIKLCGDKEENFQADKAKNLYRPAVLNNPPLMLLDEATSALDTESEKLVQVALNNLMKNRTSLIIATGSVLYKV